MPTWNAGQYLRFNDQRTRPCRELAARVMVQGPKQIIDLGCGPGNSTAVLAERWSGTELTGLDNSPDMIAAARAGGLKCEWRVVDIDTWVDEGSDTFDVVFSNAALQWVGNHSEVLPKLFDRVSAGGALAIQMPGNFDAPAHLIMREVASSAAWRDRFPFGGVREWHVHDLPFYYDVLASRAQNLDLWVTEYQHIMPNAEAIVDWYKGTGLRPFLEALADEGQRQEFTAACLAEYRKAFPKQPDGRVIFPFRRLFIIAYQFG